MSFYSYHQNQKEQLESKLKQVYQGGGKKSIENHKSKGKWTARERIHFLLDNPKECIEIGTLAGDGMYEEYGGCPSGGVVVVIGKVSGVMSVIVANDATVKAGAWFPITGKKNLRAQEISMENRLPIIYLVDSAGVFLPLQAEIFPDKDHFGRIFRNNAVMSAMGIPQIAAIMGPCVAGGAYLPIMSDEALIVDGTGSVFLAGSYLVKSAIGENIDNETLGGATTHCEISGVTDYKMKNDEEALLKIKSIIAKFGHRPTAGFNRIESVAPKLSSEKFLEIFPDSRVKPYQTYDLIDFLIDEGSWDEYKKDYGKTIVTGYARIDGWAVGIVANQRAVVKNKKGEMQFGGVIYSDSADKAARFIMNCNQKRIPLVFLQDVTGFMVGSRSEHGGIIKDGAKMVNTVANSVVPKFTIIVGNSYGAGNYAMCGKAYDPRFIFAYPNAKISVMGGNQASSVLLDIKLKQEEKSGHKFSDEDKKKLLNDISKSYDEKSTPLYAAARLWVDEIINPTKSREWISMCLEVANNNPKMPNFNPGVIQV